MVRKKHLKNEIRGLGTLLGLALFFGCQSAAPEIKLERFHAAGRVTGQAYPDAEAVMLLNRFQVQMGFSTAKNRPYAHVVHLQRIQILKESGLVDSMDPVGFGHHGFISFTRWSQLSMADENHYGSIYPPNHYD